MTDQGIAGQAGFTDAISDYAKHDFHIDQKIGRIVTMVPAKIIAITGGGGALGKAGTVDIQPMTNQTDGLGNATPHGTVYGLPYVRTQGGNGAIISDPAVGDIGMVVVANRDISAVKAKGDVANPGSSRKFDLADGIFVGGWGNATPAQAVQFTATSITIFDVNGNKVIMTSSGIAIDPGANLVFLGGNGSDGSYDFVQTVSGPSSKVKAKL